ncbi:unnamed protein product [Caenorhabditis angaria]|uniref:ShKT domain-containing protein n=1 Tax=Caenorhabditis angaria TaxID=860376 RepID=A0A9P1I7R7_9PELO|nr:unnamed protein product [Caenorhabditis angaria]
MSIKFIILSSFLVYRAFACDSSESEGPCDGSTLTCLTQVCDTAAGQCCPATSTSTTTVSTTTAYNCTDLLNPRTGVSDCPGLSYLCSDSTYYDVMTVQCPKTCGRCSSYNSSCSDRVNPSTGVSDCPSRAYLCNDSTYYDVMTYQCPSTCGRCSSSSTTSSSTCVDLLNPSTGVSDCPSRAYLCTNAVYYSLMTVQCPVTCGRC